MGGAEGVRVYEVTRGQTSGVNSLLRKSEERAGSGRARAHDLRFSGEQRREPGVGSGPGASFLRPLPWGSVDRGQGVGLCFRLGTCLGFHSSSPGCFHQLFLVGPQTVCVRRLLARLCSAHMKGL